MAGAKRKISTDSDANGLYKELDEVSCPICLDHPHNAVLLLCSSHEKGCKSYICDTSYRHSNCLDRFKKLQADSIDSSSNNTSETNLGLRDGETHIQNEIDTIQGQIRLPRLSLTVDSSGEGVLEISDSQSHGGNLSELRLSLKCPLCRGDILGWKVVEEARRYLNMKKRSCSRESCSFVGNYQELRRHARRVHPTIRPSEIDPSREQAWRRLEHQREYGDIVSAIRAAMPGAVVVGDYVLENGDRLSSEMENGNTSNLNNPWWTTFFLFQMIDSLDHGGSGGGGSRAHRSRAWTRHRRSSERRYLWGENLLGLQDDDGNDDDDDNGDGDDNNDEDLRILSGAGDDLSPPQQRRRRLARSRSEEDRP